MITEIMKKYAEYAYYQPDIQDDTVRTLLSGAALGSVEGAALGSLYKPSFRRIMNGSGKGIALGSLGAGGLALARKIVPNRSDVAGS